MLLLVACNKDPAAGQYPPGSIPPDLDTDTDGVPDVSEDRNQDGTVDPGETDPTVTDSDGDSIPDVGEVEYLACAKVNDRAIKVYDAPGADSLLMVDALVSDHVMLRSADGRAPGLVAGDPSLGIAAALISKRPSSGVRTPAQQRDIDRRTAFSMLGEVAAPQTRAFTTAEGFEAEQATFQINASTSIDAATAANRAASLLLGGAQLTGALPAGGATARVLTVKLLTIIRSPSRVVMLAAFFAGEQPGDAQAIRLEELTDGTNVARHGSFTRHVCDELQAKAQAKADILFVVDDSGSMEDDQQAVSAAANAMGQVLQTAQVDFRLGVTRTRATEDPGAARGQLEGNGMTSDVEAFKRTIVVGAQGGWEPGLQVGLDAIDRLLPPTPETAAARPDKLRDGAGVVVIHLSDERDQAVECAACGGCASEPMPRTQFCSGPGGQPVIDQFIAGYRARNAVTFAIVGDLPGGCSQPGGVDNFEPGQGYVEVANGTGGQFGSLCGDMTQNLRDVARVATGVASAYRLSQPAASASLKVAIGPAGQGRVIPRSRVNGFDYDAVQNTVVFYGDSRPKNGEEVVIGYRRWDWANNPATPPDGCDNCGTNTFCDPSSDLVVCEPYCGDQVCSEGLACLADSASCGDPNSVPPPPNDACGTCDVGLVCDPGAGSCVAPCEQTGCSASEICSAASHLCEIPNF
ncbi:MAG: VWA domain-containing protein [Deltaproteobacteria bacterium]|nr:VWA domain-containing protein [Deltaproteobacteria bacterium]